MVGIPVTGAALDGPAACAVVVAVHVVARMTAPDDSASRSPSRVAAKRPAAKEPTPLQPSAKASIWLGEQECFSWGVTAWVALAAGVLAGWVARVLTRNAVPRSS